MSDQDGASAVDGAPHPGSPPPPVAVARGPHAAARRRGPRGEAAALARGVELAGFWLGKAAFLT
jgi:hypothetical protein